MSEPPHHNVELTPAEAALFYRVHFSAWPASDLPATAAKECYSGGRATTADCEAALADCLAKGWLQVIDEAALATIINDVRAAGLIGPLHDLPDLGDVDFTPAGAAIWLSECEPRDPGRSPFAYTLVVREKSSHYFRTKAAALATINQIQGWDGFGSVSGPMKIGPWRAQWWRRFLDGYRIDIDWHGEGPGGHYHLARFTQDQAEWHRLQHILDCHNVTLAQWLLLATMDTGLVTYTSHFPRTVADSAGRRFGTTISEEECRTGLQDCLRLGWLMSADLDPADATRRTVARETVERFDEIRALLRAEPAIMPIAPTWELRAIHFTPSGAARYRRLAAEWLGPAWEDESHVSKESYREEHRYCETEEGLRDALQENACRQEQVLASKVVPIGPWCFHWWNRFPRGYRLELQLGDPCAIGRTTDSDPVSST
jgi:hypothetical protein